MKGNLRARLAILLCILMAITIFAGCANKKFNSSPDLGLAKENPDSYGDSSVTYTKVGSAAPSEAVSAKGGAIATVSGTSEGTLPDVAQKKIYTGNISIETKAFDKTVEAAKSLAGKLGGFIESSNISGDPYYPAGADTAMVVNRSANITYRVPQERFDSFFSAAGGLGNVVSSSTNVENITAKYIDTQARLNTLKVEEQRLLALLEKSGKLEDLITLESKLSDVRYQIESQTSTLRQMQAQVDYSTVTLTVREVSDYSDNVSAVRTFPQRLGDAFRDSWKGCVRFVQNLILGTARNLPALLFIFLLLLAAWKIVHKRKLKKEELRKAEQQGSSDKEAPQE